MPGVFQVLSRLIPATHFLTIIRSIMLKGMGIRVLLGEMGALFLFSLVLIAVSIKLFNTNLE